MFGSVHSQVTFPLCTMRLYTIIINECIKRLSLTTRWGESILAIAIFGIGVKAVLKNGIFGTAYYFVLFPFILTASKTRRGFHELPECPNES